VLGGWSYIWAALFGPLYVLAMGFTRRALTMLVYTAAIAAGAFGLITFVAVMASSVATIVLGIVGIITVALAIQGRLAIRLVLALLARHGLDPATWPAKVRTALTF
jgi:hypothetical protein